MSTQAVESNFVNGLITEATALNFPENACTDTDNCVFHPKGAVYRRYGIDFEQGYQTVSTPALGSTVASFYWQNAAGLDSKNFLVSQIDGFLHFYDTNSTALSGNLNSHTVDITSMSSDVDTTKCTNYPCSFAQGQGYLIVVNPYTDPFYVKYDLATDSFSSVKIDVSIRDVKGVDEGNGLVWNTRPTTLTDAHKYKLFNQGWDEKIEVYGIPGGPYQSLVGWQLWGRTDYPSNSDVWWMFKNSLEAFDATMPDRIKRGNTPAPKGHYTYSAWNVDRSTIIPGMPTDTSGSERPRCVAFFAGRAWYSGVQAQDYGSKIYYSQVVKDPAYLGVCQQQNDPTNQYLFNLLATDGGVIDILDCGVIVNLFSFQSMLLVFATNGVWAIAGNQGVGFSPTDFMVKKLSSIPAISNQSFVDVDGTPFWWNNDGIYTLSIQSPQVASVQITSLTEKSIRSFYNDIPIQNKLWVQGTYNPVTKQIQWLYRYRPMASDDDRFQYDRALTFNVATKAFYPWTFPHNDVKIIDLICIPTYGTALTDVPERDVDGNLVYDSNHELVYTRQQTTYLSAAVFKYLTVYPDGAGAYFLTFSESYDTSYKDFKTYDNVGNETYAYIVTGYSLPGKANLKGQETYITVFCDNVDPSVVTFQGVWDYSTSVTTSRYTIPQTIQFAGSARKYYFRRLKVRGNGRAIQLRFSSVSGQPFNLSGWARNETVQKSP